MKIAVNTRLLLKNKLEGIGWFTYESFKRIVKAHPEHEFHFIFDRAWSDDFIFADNIIPHKIFPPARHAFLIYAWYEYALPSLINKINPDVFVSPDMFTSLRANVNKLTVIHDISFEHYPDQMSFLYNKLYKYYTPRVAKTSNRIATVSEFSKQDIIQHYNVSKEKIDVVYNGANSRFKPINTESQNKTKQQYTNGSDFFIFVGALNPRKNLARLFIAFDIYKKFSANNTKYVIVGEKMYWSKDIKDAYENMIHKKDVIFTGRLNMEELGKLLGSAIAITYASVFEGFGIPIIEAFNAETPVITSNTSSMPEIAGDAALIVDPFNTQSIADAMLLIANNKSLRKELIEKGNKRKDLFSWDKTAENVWMSIEKTIKN